VISFRPLPAEVGERVDVVLARRAAVARRLAQAALAAGEVRVGGQTVRPSRRLEPDDVVEGRLEDSRGAPPSPEDIPLDIRYSDERVLVVSKPPGLVTHPAGGHAGGTLVNALLGLGGPLAGLGSARPGIVHRLDKDTSGLLLVARDDAAHEHLTGALGARRIERRYLALVRGVMPARSGTVDAPIGRSPRRRTLMAVVPDGRSAITHYRVLEAAPELALVELTLETGRTHQIRVHLEHLGHPVMGDGTYGGGGDQAKRLGLERPFLHAWRLAFPHPDDFRRIEVADDLPQDLAAVLDRAGLATP